MIIDKGTILQVLGSLMKKPQLLSETDRYNLTPDDFYTHLDKTILIAIDNIYGDGASRIHPIDIENFLSTAPESQQYFKNHNGLAYLQDAEELSDEDNFSYYYKRLKKFNLLNSFEKQGIDTKEFYIEDLTNPKAFEINKKFESLEIGDILEKIKKKIVGLERNFIQGDTTQTESAAKDIMNIIDDAGGMTDVGMPLQGEYFNEIVSGARKGTFFIRSGSSGVSKTRQAVGDACYMAYPMRYDEIKCKWVMTGNNQKVLYIATEQSIKEIQKMILAYLTGFNETKFRFGNFSEKEMKIINQAIWVMNEYKDNFFIVQMPNPTIELVKTIVRENVMLHDVEYVFYDYIFVSPSLLNEFKGFNLRNDEVLLMFSTALKDLAVELDIFVMTSTQVNANADKEQDIRNEASLAGSRSIINKADIGCIMARPSQKELDFFRQNGEQLYEPNIVTDIYKVRSGQWNQVRIWSEVNLGNLRKKDLFVTDARFNPIDVGFSENYQYTFDRETKKIINEQLQFIEGIEA